MNDKTSLTTCFLRVVRGLFICTLFSVAAHAAEMPILLGQLNVDAPMESILVTPDGKRLVVQLQAAQGKGAGILIVDSSNPERPTILGQVVVEKNSKLVMSPDGKRLLLAVETEKPDLYKAGSYQLTAIDISNPQQPKQEWQRSVVAQKIILAPDASAYAFAQPAQDKRRRQWDTVIAWVDGKRDPVTLPLEITQPQLSSQGNFLVQDSYGQFKVADLRNKEPRFFEQANRGMNQAISLITILDTGHLLVVDYRAPRFGIYAPQSGIPRIAQLEHQETAGPHQFQFLAASRANILLQNRYGQLYQLEITQPESPRLANVLVLPAGIQARSLDSAGHLYASQTREGQNTLLIYDLAKTTQPVVDWKRLSEAQNTALKIYGGKDGDESSREWAAIQKFDEAGVVLALDAKVEGISDQAAAAILNDYAFLLAKPYLRENPYIEALLRRAITLDPNRTPAYLNLADQLRGSLPEISDWKKKEAARVEAEQHYRKYLALGGKRTARITAFLQDPSGKNSPKDICSAIAEYANAGRLGELVSDSGIDIPKNGQKFDFLFTTEGTINAPTFYAFNANDDTPVNREIFPRPEGESLWDGDNLGLVVFEGRLHILHYRDFQHPIASMSLSGDESCNFKITTTEKVSSKALEPELCAQLSAGDGPAPIKFDGVAQMPRMNISERYDETTLVSTKKFNLANDGKPMNIGVFELSSGAGPGCEEVFFDQLDAKGIEFESSPEQIMLMSLQQSNLSNRPAFRCNNRPKFFEYQGKNYFENKPSTWPPIDTYQQYHRVARINGRKVEDVCDFSFITTVSVEEKKAANTN